MKLDILAIAAHPDDVEISASGTVIRHINLGYRAGIIDLTRGELGTRGNEEIRMKEAGEAAKIVGFEIRENLGLSDGFFSNHKDDLLKLVQAIRTYRPEILLANAIDDRHPDHPKAAAFVREGAFLAGLSKIDTFDKRGNTQERWRPKAIYHYIQDYQLHPDLVVDITPYFEQKMKSMLAFRSQFYDPGSAEPDSPISGKDFLDFIEAKARIFGRYIGVDYAEGFNVQRPAGVDDLMALR